MLSIAPLLEVPFDTTISADECLARNRLDAATRSVVWDAEKLVADEIADDGMRDKVVGPFGVRDAEGVVRRVEEVERGEGLEELRRKVGLEEEVERVVFAKGVPRKAGRGKGDDNEALRKAVRFSRSFLAGVLSSSLMAPHFVRSSRRPTRARASPVLALKSPPSSRAPSPRALPFRSSTRRRKSTRSALPLR